jgi:HSP20 family protein
MANLSTRDTMFEDLFDFRRDFDHMFSRLLSGRRGQQGRQGQQRSDLSMSTFTPAIEAFVDQENKKFVCRVALPGVDPKDVNIEVQGNVLAITGQREFTDEQREGSFVHSEFAYGAFERDIVLPDGIDPQKINAEYRNGVLEITAPIAANALPRRVEIKSAEQPEARRMSASASGSPSSGSSSNR